LKWSKQNQEDDSGQASDPKVAPKNPNDKTKLERSNPKVMDEAETEIKPGDIVRKYVDQLTYCRLTQGSLT